MSARAITATVRCSNAEHTVIWTERDGVRFPDHPLHPAIEFERMRTLKRLAGRSGNLVPCGCGKIALAVRARRYQSVQPMELRSVLLGISVGRRVRRRRARAR